ncbi:hypothetical protein RhiirA4_480842 [Rhizophagus irregularis]|uniref:Transposase domain-containing protein n=1 Tax=Rhizophagus irregularis TaxID=588596 RepID=A0A2I1HIL2_9GLOM|nr:hypothetical protein RhiirA4_480842 [Rhizophagus irregularis]
MNDSNKARSVPTIAHESTYKSTKVRLKVLCHCKKCNGKLANTRTRKRHELKDKQFDSVEIQPITTSSSQNIHDDDDDDDDDNDDNDNDREDLITIAKSMNPEQEVDSSGNEGGSQSVYDKSTLEYDELYFEENEELFAAPTDDLNYDSDQENLTTNTDIDDLWILIWIFKYQERFKLPDIAINSLISFFSFLLKDIDSHRFKKFPLTAYMARKALDIRKKSKTFATCTDCNKLYNIASIIPSNLSNEGFKCTHVEFLNHTMQSQRKSCGSERTLEYTIKNHVIHF